MDSALLTGGASRDEGQEKKMTIYTATITHQSISSARVIEIDGTLTQAKRAATKEFAGEFVDHRIVIRDADGEVVAARRVGDKSW